MDDKKDNNYKIYKPQKIKVLSLHEGVAKKIILLKDGKFAFAIYEDDDLISILIYNMDYYSTDLEIDNLDNVLTDLMQIKNNNIIVSLISDFILIIKLDSTSYKIILKLMLMS